MRRHVLAPLALVGVCVFSVSTAHAQPVTPPALEQHYWSEFTAFVPIYQQTFGVPLPPPMPGRPGAPPTGANTTGAPPQSAPPPSSGSSVPFFGGMTFSVGGGRSNDGGDRRSDDRGGPTRGTTGRSLGSSFR